MGIKAKSSNTGISVKKLKPIVNLVRGMKVDEALTTLQFLQSPAAARVAKTVKSAASNAENELMARSEDLKISEILKIGTSAQYAMRRCKFAQLIITY